MINGWIKTQSIPQGEMKQGRMVLVLKLNELPLIAKVYNVTENSIIIDDTGLIYEVSPLALYEIVVEYMDGGLKTIPLKQTQWKSAIENGELNTGKLVSFIVKERGNKLLARVVNEKKNKKYQFIKHENAQLTN